MHGEATKLQQMELMDQDITYSTSNQSNEREWVRYSQEIKLRLRQERNRLCKFMTNIACGDICRAALKVAESGQGSRR